MKTQDTLRPRLHTLLDAGVQNRLLVVNAGAGFGKSQTVALYLAQTTFRQLWLQFSPLDNLVNHFWETFAGVVAQHRPQLADKLRIFGFPHTLSAFNNFLKLLTEELYTDEQYVVFVVDDLQLLEEPTIKNFFFNLISAKLENLCTVLITRRWPLFEQEVHVAEQIITAEDLRFSLEEVQELFLNHDLHLPEEEIKRIHQYVQGWPIALFLVVLAFQRNAQPRWEASRLQTAKLSLFALFEHEIFSQYTPPEQQLLIRLAILDSFPRGLVHAVTGEKERDLLQLMNGNIFIQYDIEDKRFYFHPLYLEFLREKLLNVKKSLVDDAYCSAASWCKENGHYYDALVYFEHCEQPAQIWETFQCIPAIRYSRHEAKFFIDIIRHLPADFCRQHPMTQIALSALYANNLDFASAMEQIDQARENIEALADAEEKKALLGESYVAEGLLLYATEQDEFAHAFEQAAQYLPHGSRRWGKALRLVDLGPGIHLQSAQPGALPKSLDSFVEATPYIVQLFHGAGKGLDDLARCEAHFITGELAQAEKAAYQAIYAAEQEQQLDIAGNALFMLLRIYNANGDYMNTQEVLDRLVLFEENPNAKAFGIGDIARGWFYAELGEVPKVAAWILDGTQSSQPPISMDRELLVRIRCLISIDKEFEALALLDYYEAIIQKKKALISLLYIEICKAVAHKQLGDDPLALGCLETAYDMAKGNQLIMPFIEYGNHMRSLIERYRKTQKTGIPKDWLDAIYAKASTYAKRHAYLKKRYRQDHSNVLNHGLSKREIALVKHLSQGLTRVEISSSMGISLNSVKSMLKNVYNKLGAINSADAVRIALNANIV